MASRGSNVPSVLYRKERQASDFSRQFYFNPGIAPPLVRETRNSLGHPYHAPKRGSHNARDVGYGETPNSLNDHPRLGNVEKITMPGTSRKRPINSVELDEEFERPKKRFPSSGEVCYEATIPGRAHFCL